MSARGEIFRAGQAIPQDGIYRVLHSQHPLSPEVTLLGGEVFPRCAHCHEAVTFQLLRAIPVQAERGSFRVVLHALPLVEDHKVKAA